MFREHKKIQNVYTSFTMNIKNKSKDAYKLSNPFFI